MLTFHLLSSPKTLNQNLMVVIAVDLLSCFESDFQNATFSPKTNLQRNSRDISTPYLSFLTLITTYSQLLAKILIVHDRVLLCESMMLEIYKTNYLLVRKQ